MTSEAVSAYEAGLTGDLDLARRVLATLDPEDRAWKAALQGLIWFAAPELGERPIAPEQLAGLAGARADAVTLDIAARAGAHAARAAALAFESGPVERTATALTRLVEASPSPESCGWLLIVRAWQAILEGRALGFELEGAGEDAPRARSPDRVLEAASVRALADLGAGDLASALAVARRASRMARTESLPQSEYLANLILARIRRVGGKPHLAARILHALYAVVPAPWRPWLAWELILAHGRAPSLDANLPGARVVLALKVLLEHAWAGQQSAFDESATALIHGTAGSAPLHDDVDSLLAAIDPAADLDEAPSAVRAWARGQSVEPPRGLAALAGESGGRDAPAAFVWAPTEGPPRRILAPGAALARASGRVIEPIAADTKQLRTDSAIATLALEGPQGLLEEELFRRLYGFDYEPGRHQSVRDVLYARIRKRVAPATLERPGGRVRLQCSSALLVPDPRCTPLAELQILRVLAERRTAAAKEVAAELGIPVRTAQAALSRLAEDGAVRRERARVGLHYVLDDTTFSEPTRRVRYASPHGPHSS